MREKLLGCLGIGVVILLIVSVMINLFYFFAGASFGRSTVVMRPQAFQEVVVDEGTRDPDRDPNAPRQKIARLDIDGMIFNAAASSFAPGSMVETLKRGFRQAAEDDEVAAIVLRINSPGGEVTASDILYQAVAALDERKPVVVYMDSVAASGGYYIACGAREIVATPTTITGSIGVIMQAPNVSELLGKVGVDMMTFASGRYKDTGSMFREMRPDEAVMLQEHIDDTYDRFVGIVAAARGLDEASLRDDVADGRIFNGNEAAEVGLVDLVGYIEDAYARARELGDAPDAPVVQYRTVPTFASLLGILGQSPPGSRLEVDVSERVWPRLEAGRVYLLTPSFLPGH